MVRLRRTRWKGSLAAAFAGLMLAWPGTVSVLGVVRAEGGEVLHQERLADGDVFTVRWIHSVTKFPISERYLVKEPGRIELIEMEFNQPGPNLPSFPEPPTRWIFEDDKWIVVDYRLELEAVPGRIGMDAADHHLVTRNGETRLQSVDEPGGLVELRVRRKSFLGFMLREGALWARSAGRRRMGREGPTPKRS